MMAGAESKRSAVFDRGGLFVLAASILAVLIFCLVSLDGYRRLRDERQAMFEVQAQKSLLAFEEQSKRLFDYGDGLLRSVRYYSRQGERQAITGFIHDLYSEQAHNFLGTMTITDASGIAIYHSEGQIAPGTDLSGRDYYRHFKQSPLDHLYVSRTDYGLITRHWWFRLARPIVTEGRFDGVVLLSMQPDYITGFYQDLALGPRSTTMMLALDHYLVARQPAPEVEVYKTAPSYPALWAASATQPIGHYHAVDPIDGIERTYYFKRLDDYSVMIQLGVADQDVEATLAATRARMLMLMALFSAAAGLFCLLMLRMRSKSRAVAERDNRLQELAEHRDLVLNTTAEGIIGFDLSWHVSFANRAAAEMLGWQAVSEMIGQSARAVTGHRLADGSPCVPDSCPMCRSMAEGTELRITDEFLTRRDGPVFPVEYVATPVRRDGEVIGLVVAFHDIQGRKAIEEQINALVHKQRAVLNSTPVGIAIVGLNRRIVEVNPAFEEIFRCRADEAIGHSTRLLYASDLDYEETGHRAYGVVREKKLFRDDVLMCRGDGSPVWIRLSSRLLAQDDDTVEVVWAFEDISERKAMELSLAKSNAELEQFAYVASHDLRQPLRTISSYLALIERRLGGELDADIREFIAFAVGGAKRMDALILGLLDYSRVGKNGADEPVSLDGVLAEARENLYKAIEESHGRVELAEGFPTILGKRMDLMRLFQNLLGNAVKYHAPGQAPEVRVSWRDDGDAWTILVADNGIGIAPEHQDRAFGIFQRLVGQGDYEGTGIGLAICKKIVERAGGRIWIESELGQGAVFLVSLPKQPALSQTDAGL